jgi:LemA protein
VSSLRLRLIALLAPAALLLTACGVNTIPAAEEEAKGRWADVQNNYQRRANLTENLVETVRASAAAEDRTLRGVAEARARATAINVTTDDLSNPERLRAFAEAQNQFTQALGQLRTVVEAYPELQSQRNFTLLMHQLEGTENRIAIAIADYNRAVQAYNTRIRTFPDLIGARVIYGAEPMAPFEASAAAQEAPTVDFGNMQ